MNKYPTVSFFGIFDEVYPQPYLITDFPIDQIVIRTLLQHFRWDKFPAAPFFNIFDRLKSQSYPISAFSMK